MGKYQTQCEDLCRRFPDLAGVALGLDRAASQSLTADEALALYRSQRVDEPSTRKFDGLFLLAVGEQRGYRTS
jgi:hypothetical protein